MNDRKSRLVPELAQKENQYVGNKRLYKDLSGSPKNLKPSGNVSYYNGTRSPQRHAKMTFVNALAPNDYKDPV